MKVSNPVRLIFCVAAIFALGILVRAESGEKRVNTPNTKNALLRIVDQNGQPAVNGVASPDGLTVDVTVGPDFAFHPDTINISVGDTVRWTWAGNGHSVTSGQPCAADSQFCSPNDTSCFPGSLSGTGTVYQHTFAHAGTYSYFCLAHCFKGMTGVVNVADSCAQAGWSAGPNLPSLGTRMAGVYFLPNGKLYAMGGRSSDTAGNDFMHPFEYDPASNSWTMKAATYPDNQVNNMACGVLSDSGTPYIYCVGGSAGGGTTATDRVFRYDPVSDSISAVAAPWPGDVGGVTLPGGFTVFQNKLYILGGFHIQDMMFDTIYEFTPNPAGWVLKNAHLPVPLGYIPTTTIGNFIYTGGGSIIDPVLLLADTNNAFKYDPLMDSITTIPNIPRATAETRALNFNGLMYVMGGGRTAPNPSNEVDVYNPDTNSWSTDLPFVTPRRNFPTDTDGTTRIWLTGGYASDGITLLNSTEIFCQAGAASPTPTPTATATATATATPTATATATAAGTATPTATPTSTPTSTPCEGRCSPTPRPRPTPAPRP